MISQRALSALRCGAAISAATPQTRLRIGVGATKLLEVSKPPFPQDPGCRIVPTCAFARSVANAHTDQLAGKEIQFLGLPEGQDPWVKFGVVPGDVAVAGGILRVMHQRRWLHLLPIPAVDDSIDLLVAELMERDVKIQTHVDLALEVTIAHIDTAIEDHETSCAAIEKLIDLSALFTIEQVVDHLHTASVQCQSKDSAQRRQ